MSSIQLSVRMRETSCKWCELNAAVHIFENAPLCSVCPLKALDAIKHLRLCPRRKSLFLDPEEVRELLGDRGVALVCKESGYYKP